MSENHAERFSAQTINRRFAFAFALLAVASCLATTRASGQQAEPYVAPEEAPADWLDRLRDSDRKPVEGWISYLPPAFDENLEWIDPSSAEKKPSAPRWSDWYGKVVVVQSWSHANRNAMARLDRVAEVVGQFSDMDVQFVALHTPERAEYASAFVRRKAGKQSYLIAIDPKGDFCDQLGIYRTPVNVVIGRNGAVRYVGLHPEGLAEAISHLVEEQPHSAPCKGARDLDAPVAGTGEFPSHNADPRARDLQGQQGPEFAVESWVNGEPDQLDGRVNVVKFWRTSCPHCINSMPKTTELARKYRGQVNFIDITFEDEATLAQGLARRNVNLEKIEHHLAIDTSRRMQNAVGPRGVPNALVLDKDWIVRWQGHPGMIDEAMLDQILDGQGSPDRVAARWRNEQQMLAQREKAQRNAEERAKQVRTAAAPEMRPVAGGYPAHNPQPRARNIQGQRGPDFAVQSWLGEEPDQITGRVNVIKFWRTNCPHCINSIPKTTELAQKYEGRVNFIDITFEDESALRQGLQRRNVAIDSIGQFVAIDTTRRMQNAMGVQGVPNAMVLDKNWIVRWQGHPAQLSESMLDQILDADEKLGDAPPPVMEVADDARDRREATEAALALAGKAASTEGGYPMPNPQPRARNLQGQRGPEFAVQSWLGEKPEQIEGHVNVIKFWRTGCPHCINSIPRTTELAKKYEGRVNFIDITFENESAVKQGLSRRNVDIDSIGQYMGIDTSRRMQNAVSPQGVPNAIVLDKNWIVRWQGHPAQLTDSTIDQILEADKKLGDAPPPVRVANEDRSSGDAERTARAERAARSAATAGGYPAHNAQPRARNIQGQRGPEFAVQSWVNGEPDQIEGRINVIKFWRTGCPHCINSIPKTTELAQKYKGRINFIDITSETEAAMKQGLERRNVALDSMGQYVATDPSQRLHRAVGPQGVPNAIVLDKNWIVRWQGHPAMLTESMLDQILAADEKVGDAPPPVQQARSAPERTLRPAARVQPRKIEYVEADFPQFSDAVQAVDLRGKKGPEFHVEGWYTAPPLQVGNKVTYIEFWRTSCPHCRRAIEKHNEWNAQFAGKIDFMAISSESKDVLENGLQQHDLERAFNHFVGYDSGRKMQTAISPRGVPHAIVLDSNWIVRWQGNPHSLTTEILEQIHVADVWQQRQRLTRRD